MDYRIDGNRVVIPDLGRTLKVGYSDSPIKASAHFGYTDRVVGRHDYLFAGKTEGLFLVAYDEALGLTVSSIMPNMSIIDLKIEAGKLFIVTPEKTYFSEIESIPSVFFIREWSDILKSSAESEAQ